MSQKTSILTSIVLQYLAVFLGIVWWQAASSRMPWGEEVACWPLVGLLSAILLGIASYRARSRDGRTAESKLSCVCAGLAGYAVLVMWSDPFMRIEKEPGDTLLIVFVLPPLLSLKYLIRTRGWLAVCGVVLFSAASVACLLFNATARKFGIGFLSRWCS